MNRFLFVIVIFLLFHIYCVALDKNSEGGYGLLIRSMPVANSQKTSLILENNSLLKLGKETTMSFDVFVRGENVHGIVFRMITNKNENIDLFLSVSSPTLIIGEKVYIIPQEIVIGQWTPVKLTLSKSKNEIRIYYGNGEITIPYILSKVSGVKISFGTSNFEGFASTDIASANVRDIRIFDNEHIKRYWKLKEHGLSFVLDSVANVPALAVNPQWILDSYSTWEKIYSNKFPMNTQITFDAKNTFYFVTPDSKTIYSLETTENKIDSIKVRSGFLASDSPNTLFYDSVTNQLLSYSLADSLASYYSFSTNTWSLQKQPGHDPYSDNSAVYLPYEQAIYSFGGYGYFKYAHDLIRMNLADGNQEKTELTDIFPRYSAATTIVNDSIYIFGGRGSKTGQQEIAPRNYYDFYSVDPATKKVVKFWEITDVDEDFFPGSDLVYDQANKCFYVFTTKGGGTLLKIETGKKGFQQMSFPINEDFDVLYSYTNLYFSETQQKFYAITYRKKEGMETNISIYSLDYPPMLIDKIMQTETKQDKFPVKGVVVTISVLLLFCISYFQFVKKNKLKKTKSKTQQPEGEIETFNDKENNPYNFSISSVCFLNGFNVIDKDGNNITELFTPTLKHLLILLVLYTGQDGKGIFGNKLTQLLWFDKDKEAAQNNRNVYYSKLRSVFENVGKIKLVNNNGYWSIGLDETITCDYLEAMTLFQAINKNRFKDHEQINKLLALLLRGVLLPDMEIDWLDNFKSDFSNLAIDTLLTLAGTKDYQFDDNLRIKIADTIFMHDPLNEEALSIKCSILFNSDKKGVANSVFNNFCKEYQTLLGVTYKYSLADVIKFR